MSDAWIFADDGVATAEAARALAELGFRPLRIVSDDGAAPRSADGSVVRSPEVAVVIASSTGPAPVDVCARLRGADELADVPLVLALDPTQIDEAGVLVDVDELIVRPFHAAELRARIARARRQVNGIQPDEVVRIGTLCIDVATYEVTVDGCPLVLTYLEYELLKFLATHANRVFRREMLLSRVWGMDYDGSPRTVDVHVRRIRAKLGRDHADRLKTVRGVGYRFEL